MNYSAATVKLIRWKKNKNKEKCSSEDEECKPRQANRSWEFSRVYYVFHTPTPTLPKPHPIPHQVNIYMTKMLVWRLNPADFYADWSFVCEMNSFYNQARHWLASRSHYREKKSIEYFDLLKKITKYCYVGSYNTSIHRSVVLSTPYYYNRQEIYGMHETENYKMLSFYKALGE